MSQISSIVLADGETTPVNHTFNIQQSKGQSVLLENRIGGVPLGYETVEVYSRERTPTQLGSKVKMTLRLPTLDSEASVPTLDHMDLAEVTFVCHERSTAQGRDNLVTMLRNALAEGGVIHTTVTNGEGVWV